MYKIKYLFLTAVQWIIILFEFVWATWWTFILVGVGFYGILLLFKTGELKNLVSIPIIIVSVWQMLKEWKDYKEEHKC